MFINLRRKYLNSTDLVKDLLQNHIDAGLCVGCGACILLDRANLSSMQMTSNGPVPCFHEQSSFEEYTASACPAIGIDYPKLYMSHYKKYPENWLTGHIEKVRTGFSAKPEIRSSGASGGVLTQTLIYLLQKGIVDGVIQAKQGIPVPEEARAVFSKTKDDIIRCAQSVYIPVSMLDILSKIKPDETYAITCLPDQAAALRVLQQNNFPPAKQIKFVLGPYTGTALYPGAIRAYLKSKHIKNSDSIVSLKWRAGDWPGYLEVKTASGCIVRTPKVYYNFLTPFFVTQGSLQSMDFANEFADLAVGDAWSPAFESAGGGHSIVVTRTAEMENIITAMMSEGYLNLKEEEPLKASQMHGHMLDFKKRGSWIRNQWRRKFGKLAPDFGYQPEKVPFSRIAVEFVISSIFAVCKTRLARWFVTITPESLLGPMFNKTRLGWKKASRPTKRKGLAEFRVKINE